MYFIQKPPFSKFFSFFPIKNKKEFLAERAEEEISHRSVQR